MTTFRQIFGDWLTLLCVVVLLVLVMFGATSMAHAGNRDADARAALALSLACQQSRAQQVVTPAVVAQPCNCSATGVCTCGPSCPCAARQATVTAPAPQPVFVQPSFVPFAGHVARPTFANPPVYSGGMVFSPTRPATFFQPAMGGCAGGNCGVRAGRLRR